MTIAGRSDSEHTPQASDGARDADQSTGTPAGRDRVEAASLPHRARETLLRLMTAHPLRKILLAHEEAVLRAAASLPQIREHLDALAKTGNEPKGSHVLDGASLRPAGDILAQFLEFVAFSTPEMKKLVAGEP